MDDLQAINERLRLTLQSGNQLAFDWFIPEDRVRFTSGIPDHFKNVPLAGINSSAVLGGLLHPDDKRPLHDELVRALKERGSYAQSLMQHVEVRLQDASIGWRWVELSGMVMERAGDGRAVRAVGMLADITSRKLAEQRAAKLRNLYAALRRTNQAILHMESPEKLFHELCQIAVEHGKFHMATIRLLDPATRLLHVVASHGKDIAFFETAEVSADPDKAIGRGPSGYAIRENRPSICNDFFATSYPQQWKEVALALNLHAFASFPFCREGHPAGVLILYSPEKNFFDLALIDLLKEMTQEISFALDNFRHEIQRKRAEELQLAQNRILNMIASGAALDDILVTLIQFIETQSQRGLCSIQTLDAAGTLLRTGVAPSLPAIYNEAIRNVAVGARGCSFGAAVFRREPVTTGDIATDPLWTAWHDTALKHGLRACSSWPIFGRNNKVLGALSMYYREPGIPNPDELQLIEIATNLAGIAIENKESDDKIRYLAHFDELTALPNRSLFNQLLNHAMKMAQRNRNKLAVLFVDLDRFKNINDTLGHDAGDLALQEFSKRMRTCMRDADTVARMGGDEFYVLLEDLVDGQFAAKVAQKLLHEASVPFFIDGQECHLTGSIGIAIYPDDGTSAQNLLKNADIAMYRAKSEGKNTYHFYSASKNIHTLERLAMESQLRRAIENGEFILHYQPKVELASGRITGVEALARWQHPERGLLAPGHFIPVAEETKLIIPISKLILHIACSDALLINEAVAQPIRVAVNLSARQLDDPRFLDNIHALLNETRIPPYLLQLEITESMVMHNPDHAVHVMNELLKMGIHLDIDDFGTGYSSLANLKRFPVDSLKIDRSFIQDIPTEPNDTAITQAIIAMGHTMGMRVIAEGVETIEQMEALRQFGCDEFQGFYFSRPLPLDRFLDLLKKHRA